VKNKILSYLANHIDLDKQLTNEAFGKIRKNLLLSIENKVRACVALEIFSSWKVVLLECCGGKLY